jgi:hypothetical protein
VVPVEEAATLAGQVMAGPEGIGSGLVGVLGDESPPPQPAITSITGKRASRGVIS